MKNKIRKFIEKENMIEEGDRIVLALSGGADSVYLFFLFLELKEELKFTFACAHLNHQIRGADADADEKFVKDLCDCHNIPIYLYRKDVTSYAQKYRYTIEEAGRKLRYQVFEETKKAFGGNKIALAHHSNDLAETLLFNLARGSGIGGLCSLRGVRGDLIRPLLLVKKDEIEEELLKQKLSFCKDKTNDSVEYTRNKIRLELLPKMEEVNLHAIDHIRESSIELLDIYRYLQKEARKKYGIYGAIKDDRKVLKKSLSKEDDLIQSQVIRLYLEEILEGKKDIYRSHIDGIKGLLKASVGKSLSLPRAYVAVSSYDEVAVKKNLPKRLKKSISMDIKEPGSYIFGEWMVDFEIIERREFEEKIYTKWLDYDKIQGVMQLRTRKSGDYLVVNSQGGTKKLKDYFINEKIPLEKRDSILLLAKGSKILWVIGYRISEDCKVDSDTQRCLKIKVNGGNVCER